MVIECPHMNGSIFDCLSCMVMVVGEDCTSDHSKLDAVNSLALRNA